MKTVSHLVLATLFAAGTAVAGEKLDFDKHDKNGDGYLSQSEWSEASFDKLDKNSDGRLEAQELTGTTLEIEAKQAASGGATQRQEQQTRSSLWQSDQQQRDQQARSSGDKAQQGRQAFSDADTDRDNQLTEDEARVAGYEYVVVYFDPLDVNKDGVLDEEEWDLNQREEFDRR